MHHKAFEFLKHALLCKSTHQHEILIYTHKKKIKIGQKRFCAYQVPFWTNLPDTFEQYAQANCIKSLVKLQHCIEKMTSFELPCMHWDGSLTCWLNHASKV